MFTEGTVAPAGHCAKDSAEKVTKNSVTSSRYNDGRILGKLQRYSSDYLFSTSTAVCSSPGMWRTISSALYLIPSNAFSVRLVAGRIAPHLLCSSQSTYLPLL